MASSLGSPVWMHTASSFRQLLGCGSQSGLRRSPSGCAPASSTGPSVTCGDSDTMDYEDDDLVGVRGRALGAEVANGWRFCTWLHSLLPASCHLAPMVFAAGYIGKSENHTGQSCPGRGYCYVGFPTLAKRSSVKSCKQVRGLD